MTSQDHGQGNEVILMKEIDDDKNADGEVTCIKMASQDHRQGNEVVMMEEVDDNKNADGEVTCIKMASQDHRQGNEVILMKETDDNKNADGEVTCIKIAFQDLRHENEVVMMEEVDGNEKANGEVIFQLYCQFCGDCSSSFNELEKHIEIEHADISDNEISLNDDSILKSLTTKSDCNETFQIGESITREEIAEESIDSVKKTKVIVTHKCQFCEEAFESRAEFEKHVEDGHDIFGEKKPVETKEIIKLAKNKYACPYCDKILTRYNLVLQHILNKHKEIVSSSVSKVGYQHNLPTCDICQKTCNTKNDLAEHINRHTRNFLYGCPYCSVITASQNDTLKHMKKVHQDKPDASDKSAVIVHENPDSGENRDFHSKKVSHRSKNSDILNETQTDATNSRTPSKPIGESETIGSVKSCSKTDVPRTDATNSRTPSKPIGESKTTGSVKSCSKTDVHETIYKCPYCPLHTRYATALRKHLKRSHRNVLKAEDLSDTNIHLLKPSEVSPAIEKSIKKIERKELDVNKVASYFQCPVCPYKSYMRSNMSRHITCDIHKEERQKGILANVDVSELKVERAKCKGSAQMITKESTEYSNGGKICFKCPYCEKSYDLFKSLKGHCSIHHKDQSLEDKDIDPSVSDDKVHTQQTVSNSNEEENIEFFETPGKVQDAFCLQQIYKLPKHQPFVKLKRMKLPVKPPAKHLQSDGEVKHTSAEIKSKSESSKGTMKSKKQNKYSEKQDVVGSITRSSHKKENVQERFKSKSRLLSSGNSMDMDSGLSSQDNKCPHCNFQAKRASALKFHIDFNHSNTKTPSSKSKVADTPKTSEANKSTVRKTTLSSPDRRPTQSTVKTPTHLTVKAQAEPTLKKQTWTSVASSKHTAVRPTWPTDSSPSKATVSSPSTTTVTDLFEPEATAPPQPAVTFQIQSTARTPQQPTVTARKQSTATSPSKHTVISPSTSIWKSPEKSPSSSVGTSPAKPTVTIVTEPNERKAAEPAITLHIQPSSKTPSQSTVRTPAVNVLLGTEEKQFVKDIAISPGPSEQKTHRKRPIDIEYYEKKQNELEAICKKAKFQENIELNDRNIQQRSSTARVFVINRQGLVDEREEVEQHEGNVSDDSSSVEDGINTVSINKSTNDNVKKVDRKDNESSNNLDHAGENSKRKSKVREKIDQYDENVSFISEGLDNATDSEEQGEDLQADDVVDDNDEVLYACPVCGARYTCLRTVTRHMLECHPSIDMQDVQIDTELEEYQGHCQPATEKEPKTIKDVYIHPSSDREDKSQAISEQKSEETIEKVELLKCPFCDKLVELMKSMKRHVAKHHKDKVFIADNVIKVEKIRTHSSSALELFQCPFCPLRLQWKHSILRHVKKKHTGKLFRVADIKCVSSSPIRRRHVCPFCSQQFNWKHSVIRHIGRLHPDRAVDFSADEITSEDVTDMPAAKTKFGNDQEIETDAETEDSIENDKITVVKFSSEDQNSFVDYVAEEPTKDGNVQNSAKNKKAIHSCNKCGRELRSYAALWKHKMTMHCMKGKPYKCRACPKKFVFQHQRQKHEETHSPDDRKKHHCDKEGCGARYTERKALYRHLKLKHKEADPAARLTVRKEKKIYRCDECNMVFNGASSYWRHNLRLHEKKDLKKHECQICLKRFLFPHELRDHMYVHVHHADISCPVAGCNFTTKKTKYLTNHMKFNHGLKVDTKSLEEILPRGNMDKAELLNYLKFKEEAGTTDCADDPGTTTVSETTMELLEAETGPLLALTNSVADSGNQAEISAQSTLESDDGFPFDLPPGKRYNCKVCPAVFPTHRRLIHHMVSDHPENTTKFQCDQCTKVFFTNYDLTSHKAYSHPTSKNYACEKCDKRFAFASLLNKHMNVHHSTGEQQKHFVCDLCGMTLRYRASLQTHIRRSHPEKVKCSCKICTTSDVDIEQAQGQLDLYCSLCNRLFCKKTYLDSHMRAVHKTTGRHTCNFCPERFSSLGQKNVHMHQMHTVSANTSASEDADVGQVSTLNDDTHIIEISNDDQKGPKFLPKLSEQGMKAVTKELKIYTVEDGAKHWKCLLCGQCFSKVKYFNLHVRRTHVRPEHQPYRCKVCGAGFVRVGEFRKHTRSHSGFRPLKCKICHKAFKQQAHLKEHSLIHMDARKFTCQICQGTFKQRGALLAHVNKHDKLKPFKCCFCGLGFTARGALSRHMKKYFGNKDAEYLCHICQKSFSHYPLLLRHIDSHQEPNPFSCETCHAEFAAYSSLYFHKVKENHFREEDYETPREKKPSKKALEDSEAVGALVIEEVGTEQVTCSVPTSSMTNGVGLETQVLATENHVDSAPDQTAVEIVIEDSAGTGHLSHTDDEILSIAKQLTEMSSYPGHEVLIEEIEEHGRNEEEEKIMINMLDADEEVKSNLERTLLQPKNFAYSGQQQVIHDAKVPYVEVLNYVDATVAADQGSGGYERHITFVDGREIEVTEYLVDNSVEVEQEVTGTDIQTSHCDSLASNEVADSLPHTVDYNGVQKIETVASTQISEENSTYRVIKTEEQEIITTEVVLEETNTDALRTVQEPTEIEFASSNTPPSSTEVPSDSDLHILPSQPVQTASEEDVHISYSHADQDITIDTVVSSTEQVIMETAPIQSEAVQEEAVQEVTGLTYEAEPIVSEGDIFEPPILQYANQQNSQEETALDVKMEEKAEIVDDHSLVAVSVPEVTEHSDNSPPMYVFKKADGSLVYICVTQEQEADSSEVLNAALSTEVYLEEQDIRDDPTLEAAEILQSVADSSQANIEVEQDRASDEVKESQLMQLYKSIPPAKPITEQPKERPVNIGNSELELMGMKTIVKGENNTEQIVVYSCSICQTVLKTKKNLREHLRRHNSTEDRPFECPECKKRFVTKTELTRHSRVHSDDRPHVCNICGKKFRQPGHLHTHKLLHSGERPYGCSLCDAKFTTSSLLKNHEMSQHSEERAYQCHCGMTFKTRNNLRRHRAVHSGIVGKNKSRLIPANENETETNLKKKHVCDICGKRYITKSKLEEHIAAHQNLRSYICDVCGEGFNSKYGLESHSYTHTDDRPEVCDLCGKCFKSSRSLRIHIKTHQSKDVENKPSRFTCPSCNKVFKGRGALYYHIGVTPACMGKGREGTDLQVEANTEILIAAGT